MSAIALGRPAPAPIAARDWLASVAAHGVLLAALAGGAASVGDPRVSPAPVSVPIRWVGVAAEVPKAPSAQAVPLPDARSAAAPLIEAAPVAAGTVALPSPPAGPAQRARSPRPRRERSVVATARPAERAHVAAPAAPAAPAPAPAPAIAVDPRDVPASEASLADAADTAAARDAPPLAATAEAAAALPPMPSSAAQSSRWRSDFEALLLAQKRYPRQARRLGQRGVVTIHAQFAADGELLGCEVAASSGFRALDEAAVELVRVAAGQLRASGAPGSRAELRIPIAYELNGRGT